ncbi:ComGF family competence protein [Planococcus sp. CP5-4]|uniref:competence type IV pilus minor pilin ComGF n=1 Tax=unclassified Planococcus (in: firmicutes) TaxID=2662419 RepID=UPI001C249E3C|nr:MULTISPECIES: ComGF family competence protein [unclassified Planococcus (in: firmicutes)]MBU9672770.1 ComGF family competence protein [Planococcus sp. CP5-4_YE]MBV0908542.1 ComGF family competence protein [Planococcus sp. CP5-4_UN]MBW6063311.1 ComGF family competence protein [Planococcus sp. CP5-4]
MHRVNIRSSKGFTFLDSLLELLALSITLPLAVMFYLFSSHFLVDLDSGATEFRLFVMELQQYLDGSEQVYIMRDGKGVRIVRDAIVYDVELYGNVVRKRKDQLGHEIMLTDVKNSNFQVEGERLTIRLEFQSGVKEEADYELSLSD